MFKVRRREAKVGAVIAAAGSAQRMTGIDKVFATITGKPLLAYVIDVFQKSDSIDQIVIVLNEANLKRGQKLVEEQRNTKAIGICPGGERRQDSVAQGLKQLKGCIWAVIHDGASPCVSPDLIEQGLKEAQKTGAAIAAVPVKETIKIVRADGAIRRTPRRDNLWVAQTPQVFRYDIIAEAYRQMDYTVTDDAALVESLGYKVKVYMGSYDNIKVTTPEDLALAEVILQGRETRTK
jgi:2-C-methyl-D-erythritol 4-phosphate cytidylyltransferase